MKIIAITLIIFIFATSCDNNTFTPKPKGYFRIDLPQKSYHINKIQDCPFSFEIPAYVKFTKNLNRPNQLCWYNMEFPQLNATVYLSYKAVDYNVDQYIEDSRTLAFKHTIKAYDIQQQVISNPAKNVYGLIYDIQGNTASSYQFHLTDSLHHFMRGSLYFNTVPNQDSIQPVLDYIKKDVYRLIDTFEWT